MHSLTSESSWLQRLALGFALLLIVAPVAACAGGTEDSASSEQAAGAAMDNAEGNAMDHAEGEAMDHGEGGEAMDHEMGIDHTHPAGDETPSRAEEEGRDEYSKPLEVYAFGGIGEGDTVVDIGAGPGYNTYFLSQVVGDSGTVYAVSGNEGLAARIEHGDMAGTTNVIIPENAAAVPDGVADHVLMVREFHLAGDASEFLSEIDRMLKPGGGVTLVEVRSNDRNTYDADTHRNGEDLVIQQFESAGFELVGESDMLRRDDDDYSAYGGPTGMRYITDRMLLTFRKPE
ncbi:MAG: methyltransferase domain-containing protein [Acidobacteriota bacterium]|jgi:predicted methyltransferase